MPVGTACPCGRPAIYSACCGRLHRGTAEALTAEELMRSRYSAFAVGDRDYLARTWHPSTRPRTIVLAPDHRWTRLEVRAASGGALDRDGTVDFVAHFEGVSDGIANSLNEVSAFARFEGRWVYVGPR